MVKVFKCGTLIDGTGCEPVNDVVILVEDEKIVEVGSAIDVPIPEGAEVIDLSDMVVLPGMIDCHTHVTSNGKPNSFMDGMKDIVPLRSFKAQKNAEADLMAGFVSLRDCGGVGLVDIALKKAIEQGLVRGPRLQVSGVAVSITGGHGDSYLIPSMDRGGWPMSGVADGPMEVMKLARLNLKNGADLIKVLSTGGVLSDGSEPGAENMTIDEIKAAVREAHKLGRGSASHAQGNAGIKNTIIAGVKSVDHGIFLDNEAIDMMIEKGTVLVPTLCAPHFIIANGREAGIPDYAVKKTEYVIEHHFASFRKAHKAGVKIAMGTDAGTPFNFHGKNAIELQLMVENGMSEMEAIMATTKNGAELMGWEDRVGTVEVGKFADLVAIDSCPLDDIKALQEVSMVVKGGCVVKN